jgi:hypothetical protein
MTTILSDFFAKAISKLMIVSTTDNENNNEKNKKLFTIQYIKEEPNKIQSDFVQEISLLFQIMNY